MTSFVVVTVLGSLLWNREIMFIYTQSVETNHRLAKHVSDLTALSELAVRTNAPGHDIFESRDVSQETRLRDRAFARFRVRFNALGKEMSTHAHLRQAKALRAALIDIRDSMSEMVRKQNEVFTDIGAGKTDPAGHRMADMDRSATAVMTRISSAIRLIQAEQAANFESQITAAESLRFFELLVGLAIIVTVSGIALYGYRIAALMRHQQKDLERAKTAAEEANLAKTRFLAAMSHEVRTPMNGVLGTVNSLLNSNLAPDQRDQALTIKESGVSMLTILDDILDLSKVEAGHLELEQVDFSVDYLIEAARALWESRANAKGIDFVCRKDLGIADTIRSDPGRVRQVLFNLIGNALKFTEKGRVEIGVTQSIARGGLVEVRFEVRDTGIGIDPKARETLFTPFKQADSSTTRKYGGTGLGLAISRELAMALGGTIGAAANPAGGSVFWFTVLAERGDPAKVAGEFQVRGHAPPPADLGERPLRLLVAEDNHINQKVMRLVLAPLGHEVDLVETGVEALRAASAKPYDLILMDVQMREMDGITATREIRALPGAASKIPIIALTANAMKGDREKYLEAGMNDYVSKPFEPEDLYAAISRCVGARHAGGAVTEPGPDRLERVAS